MTEKLVTISKKLSGNLKEVADVDETFADLDIDEQCSIDLNTYFNLHIITFFNED